MFRNIIINDFDTFVNRFAKQFRETIILSISEMGSDIDNAS